MNSGHIEEVSRELARAKAKHPEWPEDDIHRMAILMEEAGEALQAAMNRRYHGGSFEKVREEVIQTLAMGFRWLENEDLR